MGHEAHGQYDRSYHVAEFSRSCEREHVDYVDKPVENSAETIERSINTPIEKARALQELLKQSADRTAELSQQAGE